MPPHGAVVTMLPPRLIVDATIQTVAVEALTKELTVVVTGGKEGLFLGALLPFFPRPFGIVLNSNISYFKFAISYLENDSNRFC